MFRSPKTQRFEPGAYDGQTDGSVQRYQQRKEQVLDVLKKELEELTLGDDDKQQQQQQQQQQGRDERNERNGFDLQLNRPQLSQMSQTLHGTPVRLTLYTLQARLEIFTTTRSLCVHSTFPRKSHGRTGKTYFVAAWCVRQQQHQRQQQGRDKRDAEQKMEDAETMVREDDEGHETSGVPAVRSWRPRVWDLTDKPQSSVTARVSIY